MAVADVKIYTGTAITWKPSGGTYAMSLHSLTTTSTGAWQGAKGDLGTPRGAKMAVRVTTAFVTATGLGGQVLEIYWAGSPSSTAASDNPAGASGSDAVYAGVMSTATAKPNLQFVGILVAEATTASQTADVGSFVPDFQYGMPIVVNLTLSGLTTTTTAHAITIYPVIDQVQASA
jgi:hypothetical protein